MKLIKFRIKHYKSITDSSDCWLSSDLTVLAGKNESGKSAILEALRDFDSSIEEVPSSAVPLDDKGTPTIELHFEVDKKFWDEISRETGIAIDKSVRESSAKDGLIIIKNKNGLYEIVGDFPESIDKDIIKENDLHLNQIRTIIDTLKTIEQLANIVNPELEGEIELVKQSITPYITQAEAHIATITDEAIKQQSAEKIAQIKDEFNALREIPSNSIIDEIIASTPDFIFFSDFEGLLPYEIPLSEALKNSAVKDFAKVAGIDLAKVVAEKDTQRRKNLLRDHAAILSEDFKGYWKQDEIKLVADSNGENLIIYIEEAGKSHGFKVEQRSKGLQWFLTFYLRLRARETDMSIILIDEPGLYLHAKAQKDVLSVLEKISSRSQVIFSTHSPYLIDTNRLDRVRLILKNNNGTKVENKIHKGADQETLTPIITAIGLDLASQFSIAGKNNVILEGISDYYFLHGMKQFLPKTTKGLDLNLIPCVGAPKIPQIASLLIGWDLPFVALLDNDGEGKKTARELKERLGVEDQKILHVSDEENFSIEDLFSHDDFNNYVLGEQNKNDDRKISNSIFVKNQKIDKVLVSKKFMEKINKEKSKISFSQETKNAFQSIFDKANKLFQG